MAIFGDLCSTHSCTVQLHAGLHISNEWKPVDEFIRDRIRLDGCLWTRARGEMGCEWMDY